MGDLLLVALFLGLVLWVGWPVTLWAGTASLVAWAARLLAARVGTRADANGARMVEAAARTIAGVAFGLAGVWFAQVALTGIGAFADPGTTRAAEGWIVHACNRLGPLTHAGTFVGLLALGAAVGIGRGVGVSRVLVVAASLAFFSEQATRSGESRWVAARRHEAGGDVRALHATQARLLALAAVQRDLPALGDDEKRYLASFLVASERRKHGPEIVQEKAEQIGAHRSDPGPPAAGTTDVDRGSTGRCERWIATTEGATATPAPSLDDLAALARKETELEGHLAEARTATRAAAMLAMRPVHPAVDDPALVRFTDAVVEALAKRWTDGEACETVADFAAATARMAADGGSHPGWQVGGSRATASAEVEEAERGFELRERAADPIALDFAEAPDGDDAGQD